MFSKSFWILALAVIAALIANAALIAQQAKEKAAVARSDKLVYKSPQEVSDAFITATAKKDWKASFRCFAPESQDMVVVHLITMMSFASTGEDKPSKALEQVFKKHDFNLDLAKLKAEELAKAAESEKKQPDWRTVVKTYAESIKDKEAFFSDVLRWAEEHYSDDRNARPTKVRLQEVEIKQDIAKGKLSAGSGDGWKVSFKKVDGGWCLISPKEEYEPSGWNDGFLFDYLDEIHHWRF